MTAPAYTPPEIWTWDKESGGRFTAINRPVADRKSTRLNSSHV